MGLKTSVYVDGFSLYHGSVQGTAYKWLDIGKMLKFLLPGDEIVRIRYFTARVRATQSNPRAPERQDIFLRALKTIPTLTIHEGRFQENIRRLPRAPISNPPNMVDVLVREEKGTDVKLASFLLVDCMRGDYGQIVVLSADADFAEPIQMARERFGMKATVLFPHRRSSAQLRRTADTYKVIRERVLRSCQFADVLQDSKGTFTKPAVW